MKTSGRQTQESTRPLWERYVSEERGATLVELMAALVVTLLVLAAGFTAAITADKSTRVNELVARTQQNARIAMELVARDVKMAGFGMGAAAVGACGSPIVPNDNNAAGADTGPDSVSLVLPVTNADAAVGALWQLDVAKIGPFTVLELPAGAVGDMGTAGFGVGSAVSIGGAVSSTVATSGFDTGADELTLTDTIGPPKTFPVGTPVYMLQCVVYSISNNAGTCGGNAPCLLRGGVPMVDGIEDLQLEYACDGCDAAQNSGVPDGIPDDQNADTFFDAGDFISDNAWATPPLTPETIRLVEITIVAREPQADQGVTETRARAQASSALTVSDHNHASGVFAAGDFNSGTYGVQRRRVLTRVVETRNLGS